ncbi:hypothetical protein GGG16DRAFT_120015 [Schizophyllum commune]
MSAARQARPSGSFDELVELISSRMWWPGMDGDIEQYLSIEDARPTSGSAAATLPNVLYLRTGPVSVSLPPNGGKHETIGEDRLLQELRQHHNLKPTDATAVAELVVSAMADGLRQRHQSAQVQTLISSESIPRGLPHNLPAWATERPLPEGAAHGVGDFDAELEQAKRETAEYNTIRARQLREAGISESDEYYSMFVHTPDPLSVYEQLVKYPTESRSKGHLSLDRDLAIWLEWVENPDPVSNKQAFERATPIAKRLNGNFFASGKKLYHIAREGTPQLYVTPDKRIEMLQQAHDSLGHRGVYATQQLLSSD